MKKKETNNLGERERERKIHHAHEEEYEMLRATTNEDHSNVT